MEYTRKYKIVKGYILRNGSNYYVLNNLRNRFDPIIEKVGRGFASLGFGPSFWTWVGLGLSIISAIMFSLHSPAIGVDWYTATFLGSLFLLFAGFFDVVDGAVARVTKRTSALGGYLDSVLDKVSEIIIFIGILIGSFTNPVLVLVALSLSMLVSYTRARGEGLGVDLKGKGIAERAERILIVVILGFIPFQENISVALWIISILSAVTVLERLKVVSTKLGTPLFSIQTFRDMTSRHHEHEVSSGTITSRLNEPPTSLSKITKNVNDYLDKTDSKKMTNPDKPSSSTTTSTTTPPPPPPPAPKAQYLDKTDPNETGRNVAHIIFDDDGEDEVYKKFTKSNTASSSTSETDSGSNDTASSSTSETDSGSNDITKDDKKPENSQ
ncbi:MAG: CDP-alcohol phosphatidyltransferase family protein [Candidatus Nitrosocosmicus sp.]|nr:CDP-alcohol phosphatidyltransferase family protein [Candidatus Nitrosocosmicus sp.]